MTCEDRMTARTGETGTTDERSPPNAQRAVREQPLNPRYNRQMGKDARYNLYYVHVDLPSGRVFNYRGQELISPVGKKIADWECLIGDTPMRVAAVPGSMCTGEDSLPCFLLAVSDETPCQCWFYFVR
ncbi:MAG: hypothetical protein ACYTAS_08275, partial [Planctomycetota bacterium]